MLSSLIKTQRKLSGINSKLAFPVNLLFILSLMALSYTSSGQDVNADEFENRLNSDKAALLLDVRTPKEYAEGHIKNSLNIDYYNADFEKQISKLDRNKTIYVYCGSGIRSKEAARKLKKQGFRKIVNLDGGIVTWKDANKSIVK